MQVPSFNPYAPPNVLVDTMIGNAFPIVEYVARNMTAVRRCSLYMASIYNAASRMTALLLGSSPEALGGLLVFDLPSYTVTDDTGATTTKPILPSQVNGWKAIMELADGSLVEANGNWVIAINADGKMVFSLASDAPAGYVDRPIRIQLDYSLPA